MYAGRKPLRRRSALRPTRSAGSGFPQSQAKAWTDAIPIGYAVTYIFGTIGSAIILAQLGPKMIGVDLAKSCADYEAAMGGVAGQDAGVFSAYLKVAVRAYQVAPGELTGRPVSELFPGMRIFVERVRRSDEIFEADASTILEAGDIVAISGPRAHLVERVESVWAEVDDRDLLEFDVEKVDVFVRSKQFSGLTLRQLADAPEARGIYLSKITRNLVDLPILPETEVLRGDILTVAGSRSHVNAFVKAVGYADRPAEATDLMVVAAGIVVGALIGALSIRIGGIPIGLSTSGGALLAGLLLGYLRAVHPTFGNIPGPALWLLNTLGLNVFIAVVGINAAPGFVAGLQQVGVSLFLWGAVATSIPLIVAVLLGHYVFKFHPAILFGVCAGVRTTTAALGMIQETAKSKVPALATACRTRLARCF